MKALLSREAGGPESLELVDLPDPVAGPRQVVIDVAACALNFPDLLMVADQYQTKPPRPFIPGGEVAGVVSAVGEGVDALQPGDRVIAGFVLGGLAEKIVVPAGGAVKIPDSMGFEEASGLIIAYGTAHHALKDRARMKSGETLLVLGASGGTGLAAVEVGKAMGARVVAAASTEAKVALCMARGADAGIVYGRGPFDAEGRKGLSARFKAVVGEDGADVIYDTVGGDYAEPALRAIAFEGRYLVVGFAAGEIPRIPLNLTLLKSCDIAGVFFGAWVRRHRDIYRQNLAELMALHQAGKVRPHVSETFPLARGGEAMGRLATREAVGKIVVVMK